MSQFAQIDDPTNLDRWSLERLFEPEMSDDQRETLYDGWLNAVAAARSLPPARLRPEVPS
jgi:glycerol kinase